MQFPDSLKKSKLYFSPTLPYSTIPGTWGLRTIGEPYDSVKMFYGQDLDDTSTIDETNNLLTLSVDTTQEIDLEERFLKSEKDYSYFSAPKKIGIIDENDKLKSIKCDRDTAFVFKRIPVYISNLTNSNKSLFLKSYAIEIIQEAKNKKGQWRPIEMTRIFMCGMGFYWKNIKPNEQIITSVFKYKGNYKTSLRLKLKNGKRIIYSKPFMGSINYSQFETNKIHYIDWLPYEK